MDDYNAISAMIERAIIKTETYKTSDPIKYRECMKFIQQSKDALELSKRAMERKVINEMEVALLEANVSLITDQLQTLRQQLN